jgi:membrane protease YdiL (CAAX protease family)
MIHGYRMAGPPPHGEPPQAPPEPSERQWPVWIGFVGLAVAIFISTVAAGFLYSFGAKDIDNAPAWVDLSAALILEATLLGTAIVGATLVKPVHAWQFGLRPTRFWPAVGWSVLGLVVFYLFAAAWVALVGAPHQSTAEDVGADQGGIAVIAAGLLFVVSAPICEEFFFRGFFYGSLRTKLPTVWAALICGVVFGAIHFSSGASAVPILIVLGIIFCLVREKTGSLYPCIGMHALNNTFAYAGQTDVAPGVAVAIGAAMLIGVCLLPRFAWRRPPQQQPQSA